MEKGPNNACTMADSSILRQQEARIRSGMYHLIYDNGEWSPIFVSGDCLELLGCSEGDFLQVLRDSSVFYGAEHRRTRVGDVMAALAEAPGQDHYAGPACHGNGRICNISSTLTSFCGPDGRMNLYGQVLDNTEQLRQDREMTLERNSLIRVARMTFPEMAVVNLDRDICYALHSEAGAGDMRRQGPVDVMLGYLLESVIPEDRQSFKETFFASGLRRAAVQGRQRVRLTYRCIGRDGSAKWMETSALRQEDELGGDTVFAVISRSIDEEKARELLLEDRLRQQTEELNITMGQMGKHISYYDIASRTLTTSPPTAREFAVPEVLENYPESFIESAPEGYSAEAAEILRSFVGAIRRGEPKGTCEYPTVNSSGKKVWLYREFVNIFDDKGMPVRAVIASEDMTDRFLKEHQHSLDRAGLLKVTHMVFPEILAVNVTQGTCTVIQSVLDTPIDISLDDFLELRLEDIWPEDREPFRRQFFRDNQLKAIKEGKERFQLTYRRRDPKGVWHWIETTALKQDNPYNDDLLTFAVSRNVDHQKAQEELLRQALADSTEKLEGWLYYNSLSSRSFPGLVYVNYDDGRPSPYEVGTLAERLDCPVKELSLSTCFRIPDENKGVVRKALDEARQKGKKCFRAEYPVETDRGEVRWVHNQAVFFEDKFGDTGYIHFLTDTTHEHKLTEQVRSYMEEKLAENEKVFSIASMHSDRTLCYYDLATKKARPWNEEDCENCEMTHMCFKKFSLEQFESGENILPDSRAEAGRMVREINAGTPFGQANIRVNMPDGSRRWLEFKYSGLSEGNEPTAALISYKDVTERHENEMAKLRLTRQMGMERSSNLGYVEADLTSDFVEKHTGHHYLSAVSYEGRSYTDYSTKGFVGVCEEQRAEARAKYARESLMESYRQGIQRLDNVWQVERDGARLWARLMIDLIEDSYSGHLKLFGRIVDITEEQEERIAVSIRADYDAMTGLLRRGVGEEQIRRMLAERRSPGGILVAIDLDDMKGINDTLGHRYGDIAITSIAETMRSHFRKGDILIRAGGDEFLAFLPGAGKSIGTMELSMANLLRKLSAISLGDNGQRTIHCSIGCAVELPDTDTFDSLYQRADMALYHVKRSGKNNFAFFEPSMLEENYSFKSREAFPAEAAADADDLNGLLEVVAAHYPGVVAFNLTRNQLRVLTFGRFTHCVQENEGNGALRSYWLDMVHPEDRERVASAMSRGSLLALYAGGGHRTRQSYRALVEGTYRRAEMFANIYTAEDGDICAFLFFRWNDRSGDDIEIMRLHKLLEISGVATFEYICLINVHNGSYSTFSRNDANSHMIPESADFDTVTRHIRDTQIRPEDREAYYEAASLKNVLRHMETENSYAYGYTTKDGSARMVVFCWYEDSHSELLMTVRKLS